MEEAQPQKTSDGGKKASRPANLLGGVGLEWLCCTQRLFQTPDTEHCVSAYRKTTRTQTYTGRQERTAYTSRRVGQGGRTEYLCLGLCLSGCVCVCASGSVSLWLCVGVCLCQVLVPLCCWHSCLLQPMGVYMVCMPTGHAEASAIIKLAVYKGGIVQTVPSW